MVRRYSLRPRGCRRHREGRRISEGARLITLKKGADIRTAAVLSLARHPVHLLPGQTVHVPHVNAHVVHGGGRVLTDGARRLARVFLHVLDEAPLLAVGGAADGADAGSAGWKTEGMVAEDRKRREHVIEAHGCTTIVRLSSLYRSNDYRIIVLRCVDHWALR